MTRAGFMSVLGFMQPFLVSLLELRQNSGFSYLRTLTTWHRPPPHAAAAAIGRYLLYQPGPQQQTSRTLLQRANGTDGRTDRRTPYRFIDPVPHTMRVVPISKHISVQFSVEFTSVQILRDRRPIDASSSVILQLANKLTFLSLNNCSIMPALSPFMCNKSIVKNSLPFSVLGNRFRFAGFLETASRMTSNITVICCGINALRQKEHTITIPDSPKNLATYID